jgi:hypothetical protein
VTDAIVAKEGLRVHLVEKNGFGEIIVGETYTAICGEVWEPTVTDREALSEIPWCYGCLEVRAVVLLEQFNAITYELNLYDRENPDVD